MKFIKELNKTQLRVLILAVLIFMSSIIFLCVKNYRENYIPSISYRVYTKENGWSKWCKNGKTCGDGKDDILKIDYKVKNDTEQSFIIYNGKEWTSKIKSKNKIYGIRMSSTKRKALKYVYCYRTYNEKNKWLNWACSNYNYNYFLSGNKKESIKAIQIKIIPSNINEYDYLDDYFENNNKSSYGF